MAVAMAGSQALKRLELRDAEALFEAHGAEEIRGLERQVRAEIEHKKEELRQMVGERYRDLIEAADTIGQMRCCAEGLLDAVRATDQCCARLRQQSHATSTATATATASATTMAASRSARTPQVPPHSGSSAPSQTPSHLSLQLTHPRHSFLLPLVLPPN